MLAEPTRELLVYQGPRSRSFYLTGHSWGTGGVTGQSKDPLGKSAEPKLPKDLGDSLAVDGSPLEFMSPVGQVYCRHERIELAIADSAVLLVA